MACNLIQIISGDECIGDSREKINNNFLNLEDSVCTLSSVTIVPTDTSTIDFIYTPETRILTAAVKSDSVDTIHLKNNSVGYSQLANTPLLSTEAVQPRVAKAWVSFNGSTTTPIISGSFNVAAVTRNSAGDFTITFITPMSNNGYVVCCTGSFNGGAASLSINHAQAPSASSVRLIHGHLAALGATGYPSNPTYANVTIFGN